MKNSPTLIIIRGLPGSGKTTIAKTRYPSHVLCEADQYFEGENEKYEFDPTKLPKAHEACFQKAKEALFKGHSVVVANTFVRTWEYQRYLDLPFTIKVVEAKGNYGSIHSVPLEVIERMRKRYQHSVY
jgi:predicted kinase